MDDKRELTKRQSQIGERIKSERKRANMTQMQFAEELSELLGTGDLSQNTISDWERGKSTPPTEKIMAMALIFQCDSGYLLGDYSARVRANADICELTGLSTKAVERLRSIKRSADTEFEKTGMLALKTHEIKALNCILEENEHIYILETIYDYLFGNFDSISIRQSDEDSEYAILRNKEDHGEYTIVNASRLNEIFLLHIQENLLDLRDKVRGTDRHNPSITVEL